MIYFLEAEDLLKIGRSADPEGRLKSARTWLGKRCRLKMQLHTRNDAWAEKQLHEHFEAFRVDGEWFRVSLHTAVKALIDLQLIDPPITLELTEPLAEPIPPVHPDFERFLELKLSRKYWSPRHIEDNWRDHHSEFLELIEKFSVEEAFTEHERRLDEAWVDMRKKVDEMMNSDPPATEIEAAIHSDKEAGNKSKI